MYQNPSDGLIACHEGFPDEHTSRVLGKCLLYVPRGGAISYERGCPFVPAEPASFSDEVGSSGAESGGRGGDEESER